MKYNQDYYPIEWQDEVVDQDGQVLQEGTLYDQENMNRMEAGIDLNATITAVALERARGTRGNGLELEKWQKQRVQSGEVEIVNADTNLYFRTSDPYIYVSVSEFPQHNAPNYSVATEIIEGDAGLIGDIKVYDKASNGFKISYTGSASSAKIRWTLVNEKV